MPVYNGASTLKFVFEGLENQKHKNLIKNIILIDDNSTDKSLPEMQRYSKISSYTCIVIHNDLNQGLARGYNAGINLSKSKFVITMHQDILLEDKESFAKTLKPLLANTTVAASYPTLLHPKSVWDSYNFWQRAMFSRFVNKKIPMLTGKFDGFNKSILKKLENFDADTYRTAGEDSDLRVRLLHQGYSITQSNVQVTHLHNLEPNFGIKKYIKKEAQIAESHGVKLRRYGVTSLKEFLLVFFRQILLFGLLIPYVYYFFLTLIVLYSFAYTWKCYLYKPFDSRLIILPAVNVSLLLVASYSSFIGFIRNKQSI